MSTKILRILMLVLLMCGAGTVSAQTKKPSSKISLRSYEVPALKPELREMADRILQYRRDSLNKSSVRKANELFLEMAKPLADSVNDMVALGAYFIDNGEYTIPHFFAKRMEATQTDRINLLGYGHDSIPYMMFMAEAYNKMHEDSKAGTLYEGLLPLDSANFVALYLTALAYRAEVPTASIEKLEQIKEFYPQWYEADRLMGDIFNENRNGILSSSGFDVKKRALKHYGDYFAVVPHQIDSVDIANPYDFFKSCTNYIKLLVEVKDVKKQMEVVNTFLPMYPDDPYLQLPLIRQRFNILAKEFCEEKIKQLGDITPGFGDSKEVLEELAAAADSVMSSMRYITEKQYADSLYMYDDYFAAGWFEESRAPYFTLLSEDLEYRGEKEKGEAAAKEIQPCAARAVDYFEKAVRTDTTQTSAFFHLYKLYEKLDEWDKAVYNYDKYYAALKEVIQQNGQPWDIDEDFNRAMAYYKVHNKVKAQEPDNKYLHKAEEIWTEILTTSPNDLQALFYLAVARNADFYVWSPEVGEKYKRFLDASDNSRGRYSEAKVRGWREGAAQYLAYHAMYKDKEQNPYEFEQMDADLIERMYRIINSINPNHGMLVPMRLVLKQRGRM